MDRRGHFAVLWAGGSNLALTCLIALSMTGTAQAGDNGGTSLGFAGERLPGNGYLNGRFLNGESDEVRIWN